MDTKQLIINTALELFAQNGYEAASMGDIAARLSLTKAALYKHFKSKRDIFDAILVQMERQDAERAAAFDVPVHSANEAPGEYSAAQLASLIAFTRAQYEYFTRDALASRFRKMLTLEQYRDADAAALYTQYICGGPLEYTADIFTQLLGSAKKGERAALEFYAPVFMLYSLYDTSPDKHAPDAMLEKHLKRFAKKYDKENIT